MDALVQFFGKFGDIRIFPGRTFLAVLPLILRLIDWVYVGHVIAFIGKVLCYGCEIFREVIVTVILQVALYTLIVRISLAVLGKIDWCRI